MDYLSFAPFCLSTFRTLTIIGHSNEHKITEKGIFPAANSLYRPFKKGITLDQIPIINLDRECLNQYYRQMIHECRYFTT